MIPAVIETPVDAMDFGHPAMVFYEGRALNDDPSNFSALLGLVTRPCSDTSAFGWSRWSTRLTITLWRSMRE